MFYVNFLHLECFFKYSHQSWEYLYNNKWRILSNYSNNQEIFNYFFKIIAIQMLNIFNIFELNKIFVIYFRKMLYT